MKTKDTIWILSVVFIGLFVLGAGMYTLMGSSFSTIGDDTPTGAVVDGESRWADQLVPLNLLTVDKYATADVDATAKVYENKPEDWGNPRGTFEEDTEFKQYTSTNGTLTINRNKPGTYYVVLTATDYNTEFMMVEIPDGSQTTDSLSDYSAYPNTISAEMSAVGTSSDESIALTLTNQTSATIRETVLLSIGADTEFRGWKVVVEDIIGFSIDTDKNGVYDEGIIEMTVTVAGQEVEVFKPSKEIDLFDSEDTYTFNIEDVIVADEDDVVVKIEILANTGDYTGANDEILGEGDGKIVELTIFDQEANSLSTVDVTA